jgi:hypothetical protein
MDRPASVEGLVVAGGVDGQAAEELTLLGHNPDLSASDEHVDGFVAVSGSNAEVSEPAAVAQGDGAGLVDAVVTDAVLDGSELSSGSGLDYLGTCPRGAAGSGEGGPVLQRPLHGSRRRALESGLPTIGANQHRAEL